MKNENKQETDFLTMLVLLKDMFENGGALTIDNPVFPESGVPITVSKTENGGGVRLKIWEEAKDGDHSKNADAT